MIYELVNIEPVIFFEYGYESVNISAGQSVTVWLYTLYNLSDYDGTIICVGGSPEKISEYEYNITYDTPGVYSIQLEVSKKSKLKSFLSNSLTVTVI